MLQYLKLVDILARELIFKIEWTTINIITKSAQLLLDKNNKQLVFLKELINSESIKEATYAYSMNVSWIPPVFNKKKQDKNNFYKTYLMKRINALHFAVDTINKAKQEKQQCHS